MEKVLNTEQQDRLMDLLVQFCKDEGIPPLDLIQSLVEIACSLRDSIQKSVDGEDDPWELLNQDLIEIINEKAAPRKVN